MKVLNVCFVMLTANLSTGRFDAASVSSAFCVREDGCRRSFFTHGIYERQWLGGETSPLRSDW